MVKTYQLGKDGYGTSIKIAPITTENEENVKTCLQVNGTSDQTISPQTVLPDLTGFAYLGMCFLSSEQFDIFVFQVMRLLKENKPRNGI